MPCKSRTEAYASYEDVFPEDCVSGEYFGLFAGSAYFTIEGGLDELTRNLKHVGLVPTWRRAKVHKITVEKVCKYLGMSTARFKELYDSGEHCAAVVCCLCHLEERDSTKKALNKAAESMDRRLDRIENSVAGLAKSHKNTQDNLTQLVQGLCQSMSIGGGPARMAIEGSRKKKGRGKKTKKKPSPPSSESESDSESDSDAEEMSVQEIEAQIKKLQLLSKSKKNK